MKMPKLIFIDNWEHLTWLNEVKQCLQDAQIPARDHLKGLSDTEMPLIMLIGSAAFLDFVEM